LEKQVVEGIRNCGFNIVSHHAHFRWFHHPRPDFTVEKSGKRIALEVKARPVMLYDISQASQYKQPGQVGILLCMPHDALKQTPKSVRSYAEQVNVQFCVTDKVGKVLTDMLVQASSKRRVTIPTLLLL
jgi:hypothetical protein